MVDHPKHLLSSDMQTPETKLMIRNLVLKIDKHKLFTKIRFKNLVMAIGLWKRNWTFACCH